MNSIKTYGFLFFIIFSFNLNGQENFKNEGERIKYANNLFEEQKFIEAEPHMSNFLSNKNNSEYNFKYGVCVLFKYADKSKSIPYLKKSIKDPFDSNVWKEYLEPLTKYEDTDQSGEDNTVIGEEFWRVGKTGGAGQYSSGAGRSVLLKIFHREILGG